MSLRLKIAAGPLAFALLLLLCVRMDMGWDAGLTAGIAAWCAAWWVLEPISIPRTSLLPLFAFPALGILPIGTTLAAYTHHLILLLLGGFILSRAVEKSGAHRRIALGMVRVAGGGKRQLVLGFMLASALCSMWISNTATTLMLLPVALAALESHEDDALRVSLLLGIAYAASIGGLGTPVGTPPNAVFMSIYEENFGHEYSFLDWMKIGVPVALLFVPIAWLCLTRKLSAGDSIASFPPQGPLRSPEFRVLAIFLVTICGWIFRSAPSGGWTGLLDGWFGTSLGATVKDSHVALTAAALLYVIPDGEDGRLLDWQSTKTIPFGILLLFGGGIAIAQAFAASGLSAAIGDALRAVATWHPAVVIGSMCLIVTFLTELTSNTATTNLLMPILAATAAAANFPADQLMIPAALSASCAFMLPVATAPNAVVFGSGMITTRQMAREGFVLNLVGAIVITVLCLCIL